MARFGARAHLTRAQHLKSGRTAINGPKKRNKRARIALERLWPGVDKPGFCIRGERVYLTSDTPRGFMCGGRKVGGSEMRTRSATSRRLCETHVNTHVTSHRRTNFHNHGQESSPCHCGSSAAGVLGCAVRCAAVVALGRPTAPCRARTRIIGGARTQRTHGTRCARRREWRAAAARTRGLSHGRVQRLSRELSLSSRSPKERRANR